MPLIHLLLPIILTMTLPFISIILFFKVRRIRIENKAIKKEIKSGQWAANYQYKITADTKKKLDKIIIKKEKKLSKIEIKGSKRMNKMRIKLGVELPNENEEVVLDTHRED